MFTNDDNLAAAARSIANHGMGERYYYDRIGVNSRLDSIQAAILRIKLARLSEYSQKRNEAAAKYSAAFASVEQLSTPVIAAHTDHVFHQYTLVTSGIDRDGLQAHLSSKDIPAPIYYPVPLHNQAAYNHRGQYNDADFPVTNDLCNRVISLPMHTELDDEQIDFITNSVIEYIK